MVRLNPYAAVQKKTAKSIEAQRKKVKQQKLDAKRGVSCVWLFPNLFSFELI